MRIRFYGKSMGGPSQSGSCPSVSVDESDLSLLIVGKRVGDPAVIAEIVKHSHIDPDEALVRVPADLRKVLWEALGGDDPNFG
ncbi:hypothetical protein GCM10022419_015940 [Nonomuraea rosea]|uniref:DUF397 domain-containing protein n=1 Tax=Nonomuraea rosea TaxID=638574 RepID=A0ABP6VMT4_9ACTN